MKFVFEKTLKSELTVMLHAQGVLHKVICFTNELHVSIFNAVLDHPDKKCPKQAQKKPKWQRKWSKANLPSCDMPKVSFIRLQASQMSCMSPYSMPLWTILTKWPEPSSPTQSQQGSPSDLAQMAQNKNETILNKISQIVEFKA